MKGTFTTIFFFLIFQFNNIFANNNIDALRHNVVVGVLDSTPPILTFDQIQPYLTTTSDSVFIINFWATWCAPCVAELPYFEQLHNNLGGKKAKIILISLDFKSQIAIKLIPFLQKNPQKPQVFVLSEKNPNSWISKVNEEWSGTIPATLIFNKNKSQFFEQNFESFEDLKKVVEPFISLD